VACVACVNIVQARVNWLKTLDKLLQRSVGTQWHSRVTAIVDSFEGVPEPIEPPGDAKSLISPPDGCRKRDDEPLTCNGYATVM
jgi:hypothetical protein